MIFVYQKYIIHVGSYTYYKYVLHLHIFFIYIIVASTPSLEKFEFGQKIVVP